MGRAGPARVLGPTAERQGPPCRRAAVCEVEWHRGSGTHFGRGAQWARHAHTRTEVLSGTQKWQQQATEGRGRKRRHGGKGILGIIYSSSCGRIIKFQNVGGRPPAAQIRQQRRRRCPARRLRLWPRRAPGGAARTARKGRRSSMEGEKRIAAPSRTQAGYKHVGPSPQGRRVQQDNSSSPAPCARLYKARARPRRPGGVGGETAREAPPARGQAPRAARGWVPRRPRPWAPRARASAAAAGGQVWADALTAGLRGRRLRSRSRGPAP